MSDNVRDAQQIKAQNIAAMGNELGEVYTELWQQLVWLYAKWGDYVALFGGSHDRVEILNSTAPAFFKTVQDCLWEVVLLHIARITDPPKSAGKENLSFFRLPLLMPEGAANESVVRLLEKVANTSAFARDWRNRRIAHHDLGLALSHAVEPLSPASRAHVQTALVSLADVLNQLSNAYIGSTTLFDFASEPSTGGSVSMLYYLRAGREAEQRRRERIKTGIYLPEDMSRRGI